MIRIMECFGLILFNGALLFFSVRLLQMGAWTSALLCCLALPLALYLADLMTGLIHWVCDSVGNSDTPLWGPMLVKPFRFHHREPLQITRISLAENLGASAIAGGIVMSLTLPLLRGEWGFFPAWLWMWFLFFTAWSNLLHRWAHLPSAQRPDWMKGLQRMKLVLDSREHLLHHRKPHRFNYCILNGWANSLTNRIPWSKLERAVSKVGIQINFD